MPGVTGFRASDPRFLRDFAGAARRIFQLAYSDRGARRPLRAVIDAAALRKVSGKSNAGNSTAMTNETAISRATPTPSDVIGVRGSANVTS
jgi:hypothetical protein